MARKKSELQGQIDKATASEAYMVIVFTTEGPVLNLYRKTEKFPVAYFEDAIRMLREDLLNQEKDSLPPK